ncbi:reverse transcriptase/maturase family protein [Pedobacter ginsenosidimutans]|nr:reverse transcriptase/maturase family protein [Pedobacter ginsenosidimutans]
MFELRIEVFGSTQIKIKKPDIFPAKKNPDIKSDIQRRPLAKFELKDKLILSLTNKYLTRIFDSEFLDSSFAFRSRNTLKSGPTHHDAVDQLKNYRISNIEKELFVTECDIKKFFDCLDHDIIVREYFSLKEILIKSGYTVHPRAEQILLAYLDCYAFNKDVFPKNLDANYWIEQNDYSPRGKFGWVKELEIPENLGGERKIGIPQGGALSGLIVNILLHKADIAMDKIPGWGKDFLYLRYCDDMVIIHTSPEKCGTLFEEYVKVLESLSLIPHDCMDLKTRYSKKFWDDVKSRDVYLWSRTRKSGYANSPWVSFLGYMVHFNGELKVRKKSIEKQEKKHELEAKKTIKKLRQQEDSVLLENKMSIIQSFETKMFSMAVGKVDIRNYKSMPVEMCWAAGFHLIGENSFTKNQLKKLDRSRKIAVAQLKKFLKLRTEKLEQYLIDTGRMNPISKKMVVLQNEEVKRKAPKTIFSKYPHSFYSILEREKKLL